MLKRFLQFILMVTSPAVCPFVVVAGSDSTGTPVPRTLGAYGGFNLLKPDLENLERLYLQPMQKAEFSALDLKLQPTNLRIVEFPERREALHAVVRAAREHGLDLGLYLYPHPHDAARNPDASQAPAWVDSNGNENPHLHSLAHWDTWEQLFSNLLELATVTNGLPVRALKIDLETLSNSAISYDDQFWELFASRQQLDTATPREKRRKVLETSGLTADYETAFKDAVKSNLRRLADEVIKRNPEVKLGMMPARRGNWLYEAALTHFTTPDGSIEADSWALYNGQGVNDEVPSAVAAIKSVNPKARVNLWFRLNTYAPDIFESHAYHAALLSDGYSFWVLTMLDPEQKNLDLALPQGTDPSDYWSALGRANALVRSRLADGHSSPDSAQVPLAKVQPLVAALDVSTVRFPDLPPTSHARPAGSPTFVLRGQSTVFIHSNAGETTEITLRHVAGNSRPTGLHYNIMDSDLRILRDEAISPGAHERIRFIAPETGLFALVVSGGESNGAWYSVSVKDQHHALDTRFQAYFFLGSAARSAARFTVWSPVDGSHVRLRTGRHQQVAVSIAGDSAEYSLVEGRELSISTRVSPPFVTVTVSQPEHVPDGNYTQDVFLQSSEASPAYIIPDKGFLPFAG